MKKKKVWPTIFSFCVIGVKVGVVALENLGLFALEEDGFFAL